VGVGVALWLGLGRAGGNASRVPSFAEIQQLKADALAFVKANGEGAPDGGVIVGGNRGDVVTATMEGAQVDTNQDVFVVPASTATSWATRLPARPGSHLRTGTTSRLSTTRRRSS
jgi:hypothetical protein